jgi:hypothetical protein
MYVNAIEKFSGKNRIARAIIIFGLVTLLSYLATMPVNAAPVTDNLVFFVNWSTDDATYAYDLSGNSNTGTLHGPTLLTNPTTGAPYRFFDGTDDYIDFGVGSSVNVTDAFTIEILMVPNAVASTPLSG